MRRLSFYKPRYVEVLIYDETGSYQLSECFPEKLEFFILKNRTEIPIIFSLNFFTHIFLSLLTKKDKKSAILTALIKDLKPKLIITYIDNSPVLSLLKKLSPTIPILALQNGVRLDYSKPGLAPISYSHYLSFGKVEAEILEAGGHKVDFFHTVGSLRAGLYRAKPKEKYNSKYDICFVSEFVSKASTENLQDVWWSEILNALQQIGRSYFDLVIKFARNHNKTVCVAMRSQQNSHNSEHERRYFNSDYTRIDYIFNENLSSYQALASSDLGFVICSTLGYEGIGMKKIIFGGDLEPLNSLLLKGAWPVNYLSHKLPDNQRLRSLNYQELCAKANAILLLPFQDYALSCAEAIDYYMSDDVSQPSQVKISAIMQNILVKNNRVVR